MVQLCPHGEAISDECYPTPDSVECCGGRIAVLGILLCAGPVLHESLNNNGTKP